MSLLRHAIAPLAGLLTLLGKITVLLTLPVGHANRERTTQAGNNFSAQDMLLQHLRANPASQKKQKAVQHITVVSRSTSKKPKLVQTEELPKDLGNSIPIPVFQTLRHVSQAQSLSKQAALLIQREQLLRQERALVQTLMDSQSGRLGTLEKRVFQTLLPAVPAQNRKPRVVLRDTQGRFTKAEPAPVLTPMDNQSLVNG